MPSQIVQAGQINPSALVVPGAYINILPPSSPVITGVPSNIVGVVGTAIWGPKNAPVGVGNYAQYQAAFGALQARKYDMGTLVSAAILNGANNFRCVRVTDGTDTAATIVVQSSCITFNAKYTGSLGNSVQVTVSAGSQPNTTRVTVSLPNVTPELYDNIAGTGNALWVAIAAAINNGIAGVRSASQIITATAGAGTTAPTLTSYTLAGGTDGATSVTGTTLVGTNGTPRTGMYALTATGVQKAALADCDTSSTWTTQVAFGLANGCYMFLVGPAGDTIADAVTNLQTAGINSWEAKYLHGDWCYWNDPVNQINRLISPQGFALGAAANMAPQNSLLNYQLQGITGTQSSTAQTVYANSDIQQLAQAGIDVIANPSPGGAYFSCQTGLNTSSNASENGDNYSMMTNFLALSFGAVGGQFVGSGNLQTTASNDPWRRGVKASYDAFCQRLSSATPPQIAAFSNQCDLNNNPVASIAAGYGVITTSVQYLSVVRFFITNLMGGQGVQVAVASGSAS